MSAAREAAHIDEETALLNNIERLTASSNVKAKMIKSKVDQHNVLIDRTQTEMESATASMSGETSRIVRTVESSRSGRWLWWAVVLQLVLLVFLLYRGL